MQSHVDNKNPVTIVLASKSPRRRELLRQIGLDFSVVPAEVDERVLPGESPEGYDDRRLIIPA